MENYVKMRLAMKDSPEGDWIQDLWVPKVGDEIRLKTELISKHRYYITGVHKGMMYMIYISSELTADPTAGFVRYAANELLYLPSIEDLLGMLPSPVENIAEILMDIEEWLSQEYGDSFAFIHYSKIPYKTWPELMLAFVQHKVKRLSWDGEGWR